MSTSKQPIDQIADSATAATEKVADRAERAVDATRAFANRTLDTKRKPRTFTVWMSDDADRVPFRVSAGTELGDVVIDLVDYVRP